MARHVDAIPMDGVRPKPIRMLNEWLPPSICGRANLEGGARPAFKASLDPSRYGKSPLV